MTGSSQIWITAIDFTQADPSASAFWMPAQGHHGYRYDTIVAADPHDDRRDAVGAT